MEAHRIIATGKNRTMPRFDGRVIQFPNSGMQPGSAAGGTRASSTLPLTPSDFQIIPPLGVTLAEALLYAVVFFGAGFGLAWSF